ncbi:MAG: hypothetical protein EXR72_24550 [Myxococcales bacterium]|nr:hypothetical protein [Myxococcales bacterium]
MPLPARASAASVLLASLSGFTIGCSFLNSGAPMYESIGGGLFAVESSIPADRAVDVPLGAAIRIKLTDYPDPATVAAGVTLRSAQGAVDFQAAVDLIDQAVVITPGIALAASTEYTVGVSAAVASLAQKPERLNPTSIRFTTGTSPGGGPMPPPSYGLKADVFPVVLKDSCALLGCHDDKEMAGGLDLTLASAAAALGQPSSRVPSLARVKPGDPAASYLLRKLVGTPDIIGSRMPLGAESGLPKLQTRLISDWIAGGAKP